MEDATLAKAGRAAADMADIILDLDKRQSNPATRKLCPKGGVPNKHGALGVRSDLRLVCGYKPCDHLEGGARPAVELIDCPSCGGPLRFRWERRVCGRCVRTIEWRMLWLMGPALLVNAATQQVTEVPGLGGVWVGKRAQQPD